MHGQPDRLRLIGQRALDRLFDPPRGVRAELAALGGIETLDGFHQADVALRDEVEQWQTEVGVIVRDFDDETQVRANNQSARFFVAFLDFRGELDLLQRREERDLTDLAQINLYSSIAIFSGHISSHELGRKLSGKSARCRWVGTPGIWGMRVVAFGKLLNKVKYRNKDSAWMLVVHSFLPVER